MQVSNGDIEPEGAEDLQIEAADGVVLEAHIRRAAAPRGGVLIAGATGVPERFYRPFSKWLATERALTCLTFDYRGIGRSLRGRLADCPARLQDWGQLDMPAALDALAAQVDGPLHLVGHSAGGQLVGLMPNATRLRRIVQVAVSSGHFAHLHPRLRLTARLLMQVYMPISNRLLGYAASKRLGWGEDLPRGVAEQWTAWCSRAGYVENAFGRTVHEHHYDALRMPILNLSFTDDLIATPKNVEDMLRLFPAAEVERRRLDPEALGAEKVGHIDLFRTFNRSLWPLVADFLAEGGPA